MMHPGTMWLMLFGRFLPKKPEPERPAQENIGGDSSEG